MSYYTGTEKSTSEMESKNCMHRQASWFMPGVELLLDKGGLYNKYFWDQLDLYMERYDVAPTLYYIQNQFWIDWELLGNNKRIKTRS